MTAFSNSSTQKRHIDAQAQAQGLTNIHVITGDIATYTFAATDLASSFDRVVSIEMFEYMKNYELLLSKVATLLRPRGKLFVHLFVHRSTPYDFESGWMTTHFFYQRGHALGRPVALFPARSAGVQEVVG